MVEPGERDYYRPDLALVHHRGFADLAEAEAPGIVALLEPVRARGGLVLELGAGSGLLTRFLVDAGHRVVATDGSPAMLELARGHVPEADGIHRLELPDDPLPDADAVVSAGHLLNYLADEDAVERALAAIAGALRPGGVLALDVLDVEFGEARSGSPPTARVADDWAVISHTTVPAPTRLVREITTFVRAPDGSWRRDDERHVNVLLETARLPELLARHGVEARLVPTFGGPPLPAGLCALVGRKTG